MHDVMIFENSTNSPYKTVINASEAAVDGQVLHMTNARVTQFKPGGEVNGESTIQSVDVGLPLGETIDQFVNTTTNDPYTINSKQLKGQIKAMEQGGQGGQTLDILKITLAQRLAFPFAAFIAVVLALPLAAQIGRKGKSLGTALGIALFRAASLRLLHHDCRRSRRSAKNDAINPYLAALGRRTSSWGPPERSCSGASSAEAATTRSRRASHRSPFSRPPSTRSERSRPSSNRPRSIRASRHC